MPLRNRSAGLALALALGAALVVAALAARRELAPDGVGIDDAYIVVRYATNLAHGHGWVWNPGGEWVDGATSPLWTLLAAAAIRLGAPATAALFALALALVAAALAWWLWVAAELDRAGAPPLAPAAAAAFGLAGGLWLAARPSFAVWTAASLMDTGLWCAALAVAAATHVRLARGGADRRDAVGATLAQVLLALARPESLAVGPGLLLVSALAARRPARRWLLPAAGAALIQAALALARRALFGWPLPNTYYAKVDEDLGARLEAGREWLTIAARADASRAWAWAIAAAALLWALLARRRNCPPPAEDERTALAVAAALVLAPPALALLEGGDYFPGARPLVTAYPFEAALVLLLARQVLAHPARRSAATAAAALVLAAAAAATYAAGSARWGRLTTTTRHAVDFDTARRGFAAAGALNRIFARATPAPTVGTLGAGALPLAYRGRSRDLLGLNDAAFAHASRQRRGLHGHSAFAPEALWTAPSELLLVGPTTCANTLAERAERRLAFRVGLADLDRDARFAARYRWVRWPEAGAPGFCSFARRDWLAAGAGGAVWAPAGRDAADALP